MHLVYTALDGIIYKESIDTKFVSFIKGLVVILRSGLSAHKNIYSLCIWLFTEQAISEFNANFLVGRNH